MQTMVAWNPPQAEPMFGAISILQGATLTKEAYLSRLAARLDYLYQQASKEDRQEVSDLLMETGLAWMPLDPEEMRPGLQILRTEQVQEILTRKLGLSMLRASPVVKTSSKEAEQGLKESNLLQWVTTLLENEQLTDRA
jgi:hypothetical protein